MVKTLSTKQKKKRSKLATTAVVVMAALIFVSITYLVAGLVKYNSSKSAVLEARSQNEPRYDENRDDQIGTLVQAGVTDNAEPEYSSKVDACYINHSDSGWTASNYYQDCYIRYVDLFATNLTREQAENKLEKSAEAGNLFGKPYSSLVKGQCDALYQENYKGTLLYLTYSAQTGDRKQSNCDVPKQLQDVWTVKGPMVPDDELATRILRSFVDYKVDHAKRYIVMQSDNYYYHESLGCDGFVFCSSPREKPVTGF